jgi:ribonuclease E
MTRKRVGAGLIEAFSQQCECCNGRGVIVALDPPPEAAHRSSAGTIRRPVPVPPPADTAETGTATAMAAATAGAEVTVQVTPRAATPTVTRAQARAALPRAALLSIVLARTSQ